MDEDAALRINTTIYCVDFYFLKQYIVYKIFSATAHGIRDRGDADAETERQADHRGTAALAPDVETHPGLEIGRAHV